MPVADFRRQAAGCFQNGNTCFEPAKLFAVCMDNDSNLKKCGIVHKAPQEPQSLAERTTPKGIPPPILWVVSKCALRDSSKAASLMRSIVFSVPSSHHQAPWSEPLGIRSPIRLQSGSIVWFLLFVLSDSFGLQSLPFCAVSAIISFRLRS